MTNLKAIGAVVLLFGAIANAQRQNGNGQPLVVTTSNAASNQLLVYSASGTLIQTISTQGKGGIPGGGNSGGIAVQDQQIATINFGSKSVSLFTLQENGFKFNKLIPAASSPVSVAFGNDHLYILGLTTVESHQTFGNDDVNTNPDGMSHLLIPATDRRRRLAWSRTSLSSPRKALRGLSLPAVPVTALSRP